MKAVAVRIACLLLGILLLAGCRGRAKDAVTAYRQDMAACTSNPPPTKEDILKMSTSALYQWWQLSRRASDKLANATVLGYEIDPCVRALSWKQTEFEQELKYR